MQEVIQVFKVRDKIITKLLKIKLKRKKFKVAFKTFQTFKMKNFIIWKFTKLLEFSRTFCFLQLFQMISCSKKPVLLYHVMLKQ